MRQKMLQLESVGKIGPLTTQSTNSVDDCAQGRERYQNQYQTAWRRYLPIAADTQGAISELGQNGPKIEVSGAIPTLASMLTIPLFHRGFRTIRFAWDP